MQDCFFNSHETIIISTDIDPAANINLASTVLPCIEDVPGLGRRVSLASIPHHLIPADDRPTTLRGRRPLERVAGASLARDFRQVWRPRGDRADAKGGRWRRQARVSSTKWHHAEGVRCTGLKALGHR